MVRYLKNFTNKITYTYCQRSEGHGISNQIVPENTDLLIIVDSSTNETKKCKELQEQGIDIVILDHHPKTQDNPYALIVNPQLDDYPNKELSGGGVVYKTLEILDDLFDTSYHKEFIDLAGIAIYTDVMSMTEPENRYFVYYALKNIKNPGIKAILKASNVFISDISSEVIGWKIGPIINATARMEKIELIIELLLEDDFNKCLQIAKECVKLNEDRKKKEVKLFKKVKDRINYKNNIIVVKVDENDGIDKGFNGLLAMKIADHYKKPTIVVKCKDGMCAGSARSINNINFKSILNKTGLFELLEGHTGAFGVEIKEDKIDDLIEMTNNHIKISSNRNTVKVGYDLEIDLEEVNYDLIKDIQQFNYLSGKNAEDTKVLIKNIPVYERKVMGKLEDSIKLVSDKFNMVKFKVNEFYAEELCDHKKIDIIGSLKINKWYNFGTKKVVEDLQVLLDDYKICN